MGHICPSLSINCGAMMDMWGKMVVGMYVENGFELTRKKKRVELLIEF